MPNSCLWATSNCLHNLKEASYFIDKHTNGSQWAHTATTGGMPHKAVNESGSLLSNDGKQLASHPGRHESLEQKIGQLWAATGKDGSGLAEYSGQTKPSFSLDGTKGSTVLAHQSTGWVVPWDTNIPSYTEIFHGAAILEGGMCWQERGWPFSFEIYRGSR